MSQPAPSPSPPPMFVVNTTAFVWHRGRYLMIVRASTKEVAPNALTPPGGKLEPPSFEGSATAPAMLEENVRREVREEVGVEVDAITYVESLAFTGTFNGVPAPVLDVVFLTRYVSGEPVAQEEEVDGLAWLTPEQVRQDPRTMWFTLDSLARTEAVRTGLGWE
ncbi:MAG: NUDIX domain-containing protein [Dehalococcoidia bacterium]|nr:NUDIX domain-containing protein [Dehalococcoidia bacterium]